MSKICRECKHFSPGPYVHNGTGSPPAQIGMCNHRQLQQPDEVWGPQATGARYARSGGQKCGPDAKLWEARG